VNEGAVAHWGADVPKNTIRKIKGNDLKIIRHRQKNFSSSIKIGLVSKIKTERGIST
jgi:hypothetical protein